MAQAPYRIPSKYNRTEIAESRSRFITTVGFAESVEEAKMFIQQVREEMSDASHHVYAYRVGYGNSVIEGASDDGEPSGTSGAPTLAVLRGSDLGDVVLVTTRYFGGTKLGKGGLVRAYTSAAQKALESLDITLKMEMSTLSLELSYSDYEIVKRFVATLDDEYTTLVVDEFAAIVYVSITTPTQRYGTLTLDITSATAGRAQIASRSP